MNTFEVLMIALALAMDAFAVSIAAGLTLEEVTRRHVFRIGFHFGLFQFLTPVLGYYAGLSFAEQVSGIDHWLAFGLLTVVGLKMLWESRRRDDPQAARQDPTRGLTLVTLSVATSLDAAAVGLSLALSGSGIWFPAVVIGVVAGVLSAVGIGWGRRLGGRFEQWAEAAGGLVLSLIGSRILVVHLWFG